MGTSEQVFTMKLLAGLCLAGTAFAGFPDPDGPTPPKNYYDLFKPGSLVSFATQKQAEKEDGQKMMVVGDLIMSQIQYCKSMNDTDPKIIKECQLALDAEGPGSRSFKSNCNKWDQYPANGRFRIAFKVDWDQYRYLGTDRKTRRSQESLMEEALQEAIQDLLDKTGLEFGYHCDDTSKYNNNKGNKEWCHAHWMVLTPRSRFAKGGCASYMGRSYSRKNPASRGQQIQLGKGCLKKVTVAHEILHALGWVHEQARADRDEYVELLTQNIVPQFLNQYNKEKASKTDDSGTPYDYKSIMHYFDQAFTVRSGLKTMRSLTSGKIVDSKTYFGRDNWYQEAGLSEWDGYEINNIYDLRDHCAERGMTWKFWDPVEGKPIKGKSLADPNCKWPNCVVDSCTAFNETHPDPSLSKETGKKPSKGIRMTGCMLDPCAKNEKCVDYQYEPGYICKKTVINPCNNNPCQNGGRCVADLKSNQNPLKYSCECVTGWSGKYCEDAVRCKGEHEILFNEKMEIVKICEPFSGYKQTKKNKIIDLSGRNDIRGIKNKAFDLSKFTYANNLKLHRSTISKLDQQVFQDLPYLEKLNLKMNNLESLPENLFVNNGQLKVLILSENNLKGELPTGILRSNLKFVYLNDNPELIPTWNTLSVLRGAKELHIQNTKKGQYSQKQLCGWLTRQSRSGKQVEKCCYDTETDAFGAILPVCM